MVLRNTPHNCSNSSILVVRLPFADTPPSTWKLLVTSSDFHSELLFRSWSTSYSKISIFSTGCMSGVVHNSAASAALLTLPSEGINAKVCFLFTAPSIIGSSHDAQYETPNDILLVAFTAQWRLKRKVSDNQVRENTSVPHNSLFLYTGNLR